MKKLFFLVGFILIIFSSCKDVQPKNVVQINPTDDFLETVVDENTIYDFQGAIDLQGKDFNVPENCILRFIGGSISNGNINFNNTRLEGTVSFYNCVFSGQIANDEIDLAWFHFATSPVTVNMHTVKNIVVQPITYQEIENIFNCANGKTVLIDRLYTCEDPITITKTILLKGYDEAEGIYADFYQNAQYGFVFNSLKIGSILSTKMGNVAGPVSGFIVEKGASLSLVGISVIADVIGIVRDENGKLTYGNGASSKYQGGFPYENLLAGGSKLPNPYAYAGIDVLEGGTIGKVYDSSFCAFTYGIRARNGSKVGHIKNSYFSINRFGFWADGVEDLKLTGCRFNTNLVNYKFYERSIFMTESKVPGACYDDGLKETDGTQLRKSGGGVYIRNCKNANFDNCRFEFNNIHFIVDEAGKNVNLKNCILDTAGCAQVVIFNADDPRNVVPSTAFSKSNPAMNEINIVGNTMARGARVDYTNGAGEKVSEPGFGIFHITEGNNRGSKILIKNNEVSDEMEVEVGRDVYYQRYLFCIHNTSDEGAKLTCKGNSFVSCSSPIAYCAVQGSTGVYAVCSKANNIDEEKMAPRGGVEGVIAFSSN